MSQEMCEKSLNSSSGYIWKSTICKAMGNAPNNKLLTKVCNSHKGLPASIRQTYASNTRQNEKREMTVQNLAALPENCTGPQIVQILTNAQSRWRALEQFLQILHLSSYYEILNENRIGHLWPSGAVHVPLRAPFSGSWNVRHCLAMDRVPE